MRFDVGLNTFVEGAAAVDRESKILAAVEKPLVVVANPDQFGLETIGSSTLRAKSKATSSS